MKTLTILHLYSDAMDLYGDSKNVEQLCRRIEDCGAQAALRHCQLWEELDLEGVDLVYLGHGKARNLAAVQPHFLQNKEQILSHIEAGQLWMVTGNSRELFGRSFSTVEGQSLEGIGLFDYEGVEQNKVFVADMLGQTAFEPSCGCYGFANRTAYLRYPNGNTMPLFRGCMGPGGAPGFGDGERADGVEGSLYKNFFATWSVGPVLVRNPGLMAELLRRLGLDPSACNFELEQRALELVLQEFSAEKK